MGNKLSSGTTQVRQSSIQGRCVLITGVTSGIGTECAYLCAQLGAAHIICACRNVSKCTAVIQHIADIAPSCVVEAMHLDLCSLSSVRSFAVALLSRSLPLSLVISNAGVFLPTDDACMTADGYDVTMMTNTIAPLLLIKLLTPTLQSCGTGVIIVLL